MSSAVPPTSAASRPPAEPWRAPGERGTPPIPPWLRQLVWWMDSAVRVPGTEVRIGLDPILGLLLPVVGDLLGSLPSLLLLSLAMRSRVPVVVLLRMLLNVAIDAAIGAIPVLGDLFDGAFHANEKNLALLERHAGTGGPFVQRTTSSSDSPSLSPQPASSFQSSSSPCW
jgi:hypothetical protein